MAKIQIYYPTNSFEIDVDLSRHDYYIRHMVQWDNPISAISTLSSYGIPVQEVKKGSPNYITVTGDRKTVCVYVSNKGPIPYSNVYSAIVSLCKPYQPFKTGKMYRFIYDGGTRSGMKRAVKIDSVNSTYIAATDLDTGEARNYTLSKIRCAEEIE